ncbi:MAG: prephenate dehydrogenase/arogenate dehydrogenase family protein [Anaerolineaceae bacterium]|nr:prephenate dehydrogenase/arogenate dehydrogenase family protein [Anaerolineaceae bacterium]
MTKKVNLTIVGLRRLGASIGLALTEEKANIVRTGTDSSREVLRKAEKLGVVDNSVYNLHKAVEDADIVVLAIPVDEIQDTLVQIAPDLKEGTVILDSSPAISQVTDWADDLLPEGRHFGSMVPSLNPEFMNLEEDTIEGAHPELFKNGVMAVTTPAGSDPGVLKLATNLTSYLGATPYYTDPVEFEGLIAAGQLLPEVVAASLLNATTKKPGWIEGRKLAGRAFDQATRPVFHLEDEKIAGKTIMLNRENVLRKVDDMIVELNKFKEALENHDEDILHDLIKGAQEDRALWVHQRKNQDWQTTATIPQEDIPSIGETFNRLMFGGLFKRKKDK